MQFLRIRRPHFNGTCCTTTGKTGQEGRRDACPRGENTVDIRHFSGRPRAPLKRSHFQGIQPLFSLSCCAQGRPACQTVLSKMDGGVGVHRDNCGDATKGASPSTHLSCFCPLFYFIAPGCVSSSKESTCDSRLQDWGFFWGGRGCDVTMSVSASGIKTRQPTSQSALPVAKSINAVLHFLLFFPSSVFFKAAGGFPRLICSRSVTVSSFLSLSSTSFGKKT